MYNIREVDYNILKEVGDGRYNNTIFTSFEWVQFLKKNQKGKPIVLELSVDDEICAYFVGLIVKKMGIKILGSPFEGWFTPDMGFIRIKEISNSNAINDVTKYCIKKLHCLYIQIIDKNIDKDTLDDNIKYNIEKSLEMDITRDREEIFSEFSKSTRKRIRQFERKGSEIRQVPFTHEFAEKFYDQLKDVFEKQDMNPNYDEGKIHDMVDSLKECPEKVLALEVISPEQECIASGIYLGMGEWCYSLATASYRSGQKYSPNEQVRWYGLNYWKDKGIKKFDFVGFREYKLKFSPEIIDRPVIYSAKYKCLPHLKKLAKKMILKYRKIRGGFHESIDN